jgi:hypothetical protein
VSEPRIAFVAAAGRSGATVLCNILGALPGVFDSGELRRFWARSDRDDQWCGCGLSARACPFWTDVRSRVLADPELPTDDLMTIHGWHRDTVRTRHVARVLRAASADELPKTPFGRSVTAQRVLYRAIARASGADVVIDTSKRPGEGALARLAVERTPVLVRLVRDPRAVAFSWLRVQPTAPGDARTMPRYGAVHSSIRWLVDNVGGDLLRRRAVEGSIGVRYEDFVRSPRTVVAALADLMEVSAATAPFVDDHTVILPSNHTISGNPSRFRHGRIVLRSDDEWVRAQRRRDRLVCELFTMPLLRRYGYDVHIS